MNMRNVLRGVTLAVLAGALTFAQPQLGGMFGPDAQEWMNHKLDMDSLDKSARVAQNWAELTGQHPELQEKMRLSMGGGQQSQQRKMPSLDEMVKGIESVPEAANAIKKEGLEPRQYLLTVFSLMHGWSQHQMQKRGVLDQMLKMAPNLTRSPNLEFIAQNEAKVQQVINSMQGAGK